MDCFREDWVGVAGELGGLVDEGDGEVVVEWGAEMGLVWGGFLCLFFVAWGARSEVYGKHVCGR